MSGNSKAEIFEKLWMGKVWHFFKNYISITEKNMYSYFYFPGKWETSQGFSGKDKPKRHHIINDKF